MGRGLCIRRRAFRRIVGDGILRIRFGDVLIIASLCHGCLKILCAGKAPGSAGTRRFASALRALHLHHSHARQLCAVEVLDGIRMRRRLRQKDAAAILPVQHARAGEAVAAVPAGAAGEVDPASGRQLGGDCIRQCPRRPPHHVDGRDASRAEKRPLAFLHAAGGDHRLHGDSSLEMLSATAKAAGVADGRVNACGLSQRIQSR